MQAANYITAENHATTYAYEIKRKDEKIAELNETIKDLKDDNRAKDSQILKLSDQVSKLRNQLQTANLTQTTKQGQLEDRQLMIMRDVQEKTTHSI